MNGTARNTLWALNTLLTSLLVVTSWVEGFSRGAPYYACRTLMPSHPGKAQEYRPETFPYTITISPASAMPGEQVTVTVSTSASEELRGLMALAEDAEHNRIPGFLVSDTSDLKIINCKKDGKAVDNTAVTHSKKLTATSSSFEWTVPSNAVIGTTYHINMTIVKKIDVYWVGVATPLTVGKPPASSPTIQSTTTSPTTTTTTTTTTTATTATDKPTTSTLQPTTASEPPKIKPSTGSASQLPSVPSSPGSEGSASRQPSEEGERNGGHRLSAPEQARNEGKLTSSPLSDQHGLTHSQFSSTNLVDGVQGFRTNPLSQALLHRPSANPATNPENPRRQASDSRRRMASWLSHWFG